MESNQQWLKQVEEGHIIVSVQYRSPKKRKTEELKRFDWTMCQKYNSGEKENIKDMVAKVFGFFVANNLHFVEGVDELPESDPNYSILEDKKRAEKIIKKLKPGVNIILNGQLL